MRAAAVGLVLVVVLAGCSGADEPAAAPAVSSTPAAEVLPEVPGIAGEAVQLRTDAALGGQVQVRLTDTGPAPFTVTSVQLDSPGFAPVPARAVAAAYAPGQTIDLPTPFGAVDCATGVDPVAARVTVVRPEGTTEELRVPLAGDTMAQVHDAECAVERVLAVVGIAVEDLTEAGTTTTGVVVLTRRSGDDPVEVTRLGGSVVLQPVLEDDLPVTLPSDRDELRLPVTFDAARCDPHALAETKKPFVFPLAVTVGDGGSVPVDLPLDDAQKAQLEEFLGRVCTG
ncbi:hypothetical protein [Modestobacter excelsi]|uniref:hypothetical protein n=1 Tax=Modestobacter excelsi TaxID=2213161 RepID=UPI00110D123D|nr:hypothetical protein [Modestobacter excelsi]